jgi:uncharacterized membrane protein (DUF2068 family)
MARYSSAVHVPVHLYYTIEAISITRDQNYSVTLVIRLVLNRRAITRCGGNLGEMHVPVQEIPPEAS